MPVEFAKRLFERRVLWFVWMEPAAISRLHFADLSAKFSYHGLVGGTPPGLLEPVRR